MIEHISPENSKPYPSWKWVDVIIDDIIIGGYWDSPKPLPLDNGIIFRWNEEVLEWESVDE